MTASSNGRQHSESEYSAAPSHHSTLKAAYPTHWNSTSYNWFHCRNEERSDECSKTHWESRHVSWYGWNWVAGLNENFLKPFESFTGLDSTKTATLSLVPLIKLQIHKLCNINVSVDSLVGQTIKDKIRDKLDHRLLESKAMKFHRILGSSSEDVMPIKRWWLSCKLPCKCWYNEDWFFTAGATDSTTVKYIISWRITENYKRLLKKTGLNDTTEAHPDKSVRTNHWNPQ